jgi:hypothetical protein
MRVVNYPSPHMATQRAPQKSVSVTKVCSTHMTREEDIIDKDRTDVLWAIIRMKDRESVQRNCFTAGSFEQFTE